MRILFALPILLLGACNVDRDSENGTTTVEFNEEVAQNTAADVGNHASNIAGHISNDVQDTAGKVQNEVGDVDVDVDVNRNAPAGNNN